MEGIFQSLAPECDLWTELALCELEETAQNIDEAIPPDRNSALVVGDEG